MIEPWTIPMIQTANPFSINLSFVRYMFYNNSFAYGFLFYLVSLTVNSYILGRYLKVSEPTRFYSNGLLCWKNSSSSS